MIDAKIVDTTSHNHAKITSRGELVVAPFNFSSVQFQNMNSDNTAFNFFGPSANQQFVITTVIADADRNVGANGATVDIYEADSATEGTIVKQILKFDLVKQTSKILTGLNLAITTGKWINAKSDDSNILMTIGGYFVPT